MKILGLFFGIVLMCGVAFADTNSYTANASPVIVALNSTTTYQNITFSYTTRNLKIENADSDSYVLVDLKSDTNTTDTGKCTLIKPAGELTLYDFATSGISVLFDTVGYGPANAASPIIITPTF